MFEWWYDLDPWLRRGLALALLAVSTVFYVSGHIWGWSGLAAVGVALLLFSGPSDSEKKGYRS